MKIGIAEAIQRTVEHREVFHDEMLHVMRQIMRGELSPAQIAGFIIGLRVKKETVGEIAAAAQVMREFATMVPLKDLANVVDVVGTGGDGAHTFNISTAATFVCAAAGGRVAKHGNRSVSSRSGSADVLAALGVKIEIDAETAGRTLDAVGITFLFAPLLHPAMREVMPVRRELGLRTIFNVLGPLTNPAGARRQVMGVYSESLVEPIGYVLRDLGAEHALVVHGDGLDEITTTGSTRVAEVKDGEVRIYDLEPERFGLTRARQEDLAGGTPEENAEAARRIFAGEGGPLADVTALNAGAALYVGGAAATLEEGVERARQTLASGAAAEKLEELRSFPG